MSGANGGESSTTALIPAPAETVYRAFTEPAAIEAWMAPGEMTGRIHAFDGRVGGGYRMSLFYPATGEAMPGKSGEREDRYTARFLELAPAARLALAIAFETDDPAFAGELIMTVTLVPRDDGTAVTIAFAGLPPGIRPEDNHAGTRASLEKLARYLAATHGPDRTADSPPGA